MRMCGIEATLSYQATRDTDPTDPSGPAKPTEGSKPALSVARLPPALAPAQSPLMLQLANMRQRGPRSSWDRSRARAA